MARDERDERKRLIAQINGCSEDDVTGDDLRRVAKLPIDELRRSAEHAQEQRAAADRRLRPLYSPGEARERVRIMGAINAQERAAGLPESDDDAPTAELQARLDRLAGEEQIECIAVEGFTCDDRRAGRSFLAAAGQRIRVARSDFDRLRAAGAIRLTEEETPAPEDDTPLRRELIAQINGVELENVTDDDLRRAARLSIDDLRAALDAQRATAALVAQRHARRSLIEEHAERQRALKRLQAERWAEKMMG